MQKAVGEEKEPFIMEFPKDVLCKQSLVLARALSEEWLNSDTIDLKDEDPEALELFCKLARAAVAPVLWP